MHSLVGVGTVSASRFGSVLATKVVGGRTGKRTPGKRAPWRSGPAPGAARRFRTRRKQVLLERWLIGGRHERLACSRPWTVRWGPHPSRAALTIGAAPIRQISHKVFGRFATVRSEDFRGMQRIQRQVGDQLIAGIVVYAGQSPTADPAVQQSAEHIPVLGAVRLMLGQPAVGHSMPRCPSPGMTSPDHQPNRGERDSAWRSWAPE